MTDGQRWILMADIIRSRNAPPQHLMRGFRSLVNEANRTFASHILSPLTITLGDEFQGVLRSFHAGLDILIWFEERTLATGFPCRLRYVFHRGKIETPINRRQAYGMLGAGLTAARASLENLKKGNARFLVQTGGGPEDQAINLAFALLQATRDFWKSKDYPLIALFLKFRDYKAVALKWKRHPSSVFRRQRSLRIDEYFHVKALIECLATLWTSPDSLRSAPSS
ncbi:conserved hypothetical protein [Candidatus Sulfopaludibacter sp. SbA3]|nr:conserved hypothetical protein [Candidatus Sulfopaludibacter sp. SbA3]